MRFTSRTFYRGHKWINYLRLDFFRRHAMFIEFSPMWGEELVRGVSVKLGLLAITIYIKPTVWSLFTNNFRVLIHRVHPEN